VDRTARERAKTDPECAAQIAQAEEKWRERRTIIDADTARREAEKPLAEREREHAEAVEQGQFIVNRLQDALGRQGITDPIEDWPSLKRACRKYWRKAGRPAADFRRVGPRTILWLAETQNRLPRSEYAQHRPLSLNMGPVTLLGTDYRGVILDKIRRIDYDGRALVTTDTARHDLAKLRAEANRERIGADWLPEPGLQYNPRVQIRAYEPVAFMISASVAPLLSARGAAAFLAGALSGGTCAPCAAAAAALSVALVSAVVICVGILFCACFAHDD